MRNWAVALPGTVGSDTLEFMATVSTSFSEDDWSFIEADVKLGIEELDRGLGAPWDVEEVKAEGRARLKARREDA